MPAFAGMTQQVTQKMKRSLRSVRFAVFLHMRYNKALIIFETCPGVMWVGTSMLD